MQPPTNPRAVRRAGGLPWPSDAPQALPPQRVGLVHRPKDSGDLADNEHAAKRFERSVGRVAEVASLGNRPRNLRLIELPPPRARRGINIAPGDGQRRTVLRCRRPAT